MNDEGLRGLVGWEMVVMKWLVEMRAVVPEGKRCDRSKGCPLKGNDPLIKVSW
jgi:hypothetical protein